MRETSEKLYDKRLFYPHWKEKPSQNNDSGFYFLCNDLVISYASCVHLFENVLYALKIGFNFKPKDGFSALTKGRGL